MTALTRQTIDLDGEWRFVRDTARQFTACSLPAGEPIAVPGCWEAQVPQPYRVVTAWYHRSSEIPGAWADGNVVLTFGAVMYRCVVWVNGERVGSHEGGYTAFSIDVPHALVRWGAENVIAVEVQNPMNALADYPAFTVERVNEAEALLPDLPLSQAPHGKQTWYSSQSGIWQSVRLERVGGGRLEMMTVRPDSAARAIVSWRVGGLDPDPSGRIELTVLDPAGVRVARTRADAGAGSAELRIPDPMLWDFETPHLYRLEARLLRADGTQDDSLARRFGMRTIATEDGCVTLNGRPIYLLGVLDQDLYPETISTPPSMQFLRDQLRRVKELGFNVLRCHIKVPDPAYLDVADEEGVLVWCELPNWSRFTNAAAERGRDTLQAMVETIGHHPSIGIWTIINEDWGTRLRHERRDREWLRGMVSWLKHLDPSRLVVDNSACETDATPNFHVRSDLADFHVYVAQDDPHAWRHKIAEFAMRPSWLWSPHGDAEPVGDEPLVLSEFGGWGLPRLDRLVEDGAGEPWWFGTGRGYYRPSGVLDRFERYGLDRLWSTYEDLAEATQWLQFEALQLQIAELRSHRSITGYVATELSDATWEANGLLDARRGPKVYHERFGEINAPDVVGILAERRDVRAGDALSGGIFLSSYGAEEASAGRVDWMLDLGSSGCLHGELAVYSWPRFGVAHLGTLSVQTPPVADPTDAWLTLTARDDRGVVRAQSRVRFAVVPEPPSDRRARRIAVHDPLGIWGLNDRVEGVGHRAASLAQADLVVAAELTRELVDYADAGGRVLVLVRTASAVPSDLPLGRRVGVHLRRLPHEGWPGQRSPWDGDWVSSYSWIRPGTFPGLPDRTMLDLAYAEVLPDHVLLGYEPERHGDEVDAGMFAGWLHEPAALLWRFSQGAGSITLTTFRVAPESGPVATALFEGLVDTASRRSAGEGAA